MSSISELQRLLTDVMRTDQYRFRSRLSRLRDRQEKGKSVDREFETLKEQIDKSHRLLKERTERLPQPTFDERLPVSQRLDELETAIRENQVIVVCGETGSGKSTQLPKICLRCGLGKRGLIGHTQPRRIAARSVAARVAEELGSPIGSDVGFKIRFTDQTKPHSYIKLMTDGILLAETQGDRFLNQYDVIILDEAHERSLNIDFLLGYIKRLLPKRPDLKLIITSATIDAERFADHFSTDTQKVPVIEVSGRTFPVEVVYRPLEQPEDESIDPQDQFDGIESAIREISRIDRGDILVFLPTEGDIRTAAKRLRGRALPGDGASATEVLPLYARLSTAEQNKIFQTSKKRRIVLATNVAESSLTVPGIRYVIDTGTARISRYAPRSKVQRLPIEAISAASADQRAGRCGRVAEGVCIRLYSEEDFAARDRYTTPEIRRTNLASVILQTMALRLGPIAEFPFLDPPRPEAIRDGIKTLFELEAIDGRHQLTEMGRTLSRLPVDPRIGRMLIEAHEQNCLAEILVIATALEVQDPRDRPAEKKKAADDQHEKFKDEQSDFMSFLNLWDWFHERKSELSQNRLRKACQQNFISFQRMRQWQDVHRQMLRLVEQTGMKPGARHNDSAALHRSLMTGLLSGIAFKGDGHEYTGCGGVKFVLWPGSGVFKSGPKWIMVSEILETSRRYGRTVAKIDPSWIEPLAEHVLKRSHSEPHWSKKHETCMAYERVSLFGLPIVLRRRVRFATKEPDVSRQLMIQHGLVEGQMRCRESFFQKNQAMVEEIGTLADKTRRHDLVLDDQRVIEFYTDRLPDEIFDGNSLKKAFRKRRDELNQLLTMTENDLIGDDEEGYDSNHFPDEITVGRLELPVDYRFHPGASDDGVTIKVPQHGLAQLTPRQLGWLVPGLIESKIVALIRSLPKSLRRNFVPAPETAKLIVEKLEFGKGQFEDRVAAELSRFSQVPIRVEDFSLENFNQHLQFNIEVIDDEGNCLKKGRDLVELRQEFNVSQHTEVQDIDDQQWNRDGITEWDFDSFPKQIDIVRGGVTVPVFPTLVDQGESVSTRLYDSEPTATTTTFQGLTRLFSVARKKELRAQVQWLPDLPKIKLYAAPLFNSKRLDRHLSDLIAKLAFVEGKPIPRDSNEFQARQEKSLESISVATQDVAKTIPKLFKRYHELAVEIENTNPEKWPDALGDIKRQRSNLLNEGFLTQTPWTWLQQFPRYFDAMIFRLERLPSNGVVKDRSMASDVHDFWQQYEKLAEQHQAEGIVDPNLTQVRWMIEEFRVSLFAQKLGTALTVSKKRIDKQFDKIR